MLKHKRFLGIPLAAVVIVVAALACVGGGFAAAQWLFTQNNAASVQIMGSGFTLYKDAACTQQLQASDALAFGQVRQGVNSVVHLWGKSTGTDTTYPSLKQTGLDSSLTLTSGSFGTIGTTLVPLYSLTFAWPDTIFAGPIDTNATTLPVEADPTSILTGKTVVKLDTEVMRIVSFTTTSITVARAQYGTAPAAHLAHTLTYCGTVTGTGLAAGASMPIDLTISVSGDTTGKLGTTNNLTVSFEARSDY